MGWMQPAGHVLPSPELVFIRNMRERLNTDAVCGAIYWLMYFNCIVYIWYVIT